MKRSLDLLDQIIEMEQEKDKIFKGLAIKANKASLAVGESRVLFHLKALKELMIEEFKEEADDIFFNS